MPTAVDSRSGAAEGDAVIRVLLADESARIIENLSKRLGQEEDLAVCAVAGDGDTALQEALRTQPDVAVVDAGLPGMDGIQTTEMLVQYLPNTGVILLSMEAENEAFRRAMLAGAREFLQKPFSGDELVAAIRRVHAYGQRKGAPTSPPVAGAAPSLRGKLLTVVGAKGGVGKSVIAANLAVSLGRSCRVALVDCSLQFGDIGILLDVSGERTIADLAANNAVADHDVVEEVMVDGPGGVRVLTAPVSPELADYVTTQHLRALIEQLRHTYDCIVVDTATHLSEISLDLVEMADKVLLVTDLSATGVKNARLLQTVMGVLKVDPERFVLVVNHRDGAGELERGYVENVLKSAATVEIPYEPSVVATSIARGVPLMLSHPQSQAAARIGGLADLLAPPSALRARPEADPVPVDASGSKRRRRLGMGRTRTDQASSSD
ncbi:MAG: response regulator [Candidatus Dormibacteria bacterium]|jgi:pilus assembly protein CpaE